MKGIKRKSLTKKINHPQSGYKKLIKPLIICTKMHKKC